MDPTTKWQTLDQKFIGVCIISAQLRCAEDPHSVSVRIITLTFIYEVTNKVSTMLKMKIFIPLVRPSLYQITHDGPYYLEANSATQTHSTLHQNTLTHFLAITASQLSVHGIGLEFNAQALRMQGINYTAS